MAKEEKRESKRVKSRKAVPTKVKSKKTPSASSVASQADTSQATLPAKRKPSAICPPENLGKDVVTINICVSLSGKLPPNLTVDDLSVRIWRPANFNTDKNLSRDPSAPSDAMKGVCTFYVEPGITSIQVHGVHGSGSFDYPIPVAPIKRDKDIILLFTFVGCQGVRPRGNHRR